MRGELPDLRYDYYASSVNEVVLGPRREVSLVLELGFDRNSHRPGVQGSTIRVRFGNVLNFDEVQTFFEQFSSDGETLHHLRYDPVERSSPSNLFMRLEWDRSEETITIHCRNVTVSDPSMLADV